MNQEQFDNQRFGATSLVKVTNKNSHDCGKIFKVTAVDFSEGIIEYYDNDGDNVWRRFESVEIIG